MKEATVTDISFILHELIPENASEFLNEINCGGLWKPNPELFNACCSC